MKFTTITLGDGGMLPKKLRIMLTGPEGISTLKDQRFLHQQPNHDASYKVVDVISVPGVSSYLILRHGVNAVTFENSGELGTLEAALKRLMSEPQEY